MKQTTPMVENRSYERNHPRKLLGKLTANENRSRDNLFLPLILFGLKPAWNASIGINNLQIIWRAFPMVMAEVKYVLVDIFQDLNAKITFARLIRIWLSNKNSYWHTAWVRLVHTTTADPFLNSNIESHGNRKIEVLS